MLDAAGWTIERDSVSTRSDYGVEVTYVSGQQRLTLSWVRARWFDGLLVDTERETGTTNIEVLGQQATYAAFDSSQQMAFAPVRDGYGLRVDGAFTTPAAFASLVADLRRVDQTDFAAGLPSGTVLPDQSDGVAGEMLAATQAPDGTVVEASPGFNARYQVAAGVVRDVGCAWVASWVGGDEAARSRPSPAAASGPRSSRTCDSRTGSW